MKKTILFISFLFALSVSISAQTDIRLNGRDFWSNYYPNTKNIKAEISASDLVEVFVVDALNLERFKKGQSYSMFYNYGRVTSVSVNLSLKKGAYYLVVNNFAWFGSKNVRIILYR